MDSKIAEIKKLTSRITMNVLGTELSIRIERDNVRPKDGRIFLQIIFDTACTKNKEQKEWHGRKWYLSDAMTNDEIIKTAYSALKAAVEHEAMEGFKVDGVILFNPHLDFEELLTISNKEVRRADNTTKEFMLSKYKKSGKFDINGVEILEGSIINADGYKSDIERNSFHCVEFCDGEFGSDIYSDFEPLSRYKTIEVVGHCTDYKHLMNSEEFDWSGNLGAVIK